MTTTITRHEIRIAYSPVVAHSPEDDLPAAYSWFCAGCGASSDWFEVTPETDDVDAWERADVAASVAAVLASREHAAETYVPADVRAAILDRHHVATR
jgi:hypothetical protein